MDIGISKGCSWLSTHVGYKSLSNFRNAPSPPKNRVAPFRSNGTIPSMTCRSIVFALARPIFRLYYASSLFGDARSVTHMDLSHRGRQTPPALRSTSAPENHRYHAMSKCLYNVCGFPPRKTGPALRWFMAWAPRRIQQKL
jgi:hypothetical protein